MRAACYLSLTRAFSVPRAPSPSPSFPRPMGPVVCLENRYNSVYLESESDIGNYTNIFDWRRCVGASHDPALRGPRPGRVRRDERRVRLLRGAAGHAQRHCSRGDAEQAKRRPAAPLSFLSGRCRTSGPPASWLAPTETGSPPLDHAPGHRTSGAVGHRRPSGETSDGRPAGRHERSRRTHPGQRSR